MPIRLARLPPFNPDLDTLDREAFVTLSLPSRTHDAAAIAADPALSEVLRNSVAALVRAIVERG